MFRSTLGLASNMGNGSSKAVEADHSIENLEFNSDEHVGNWSQVPNNSPASTKVCLSRSQGNMPGYKYSSRS